MSHEEKGCSGQEKEVSKRTRIHRKGDGWTYERKMKSRIIYLQVVNRGRI